MSSSAAAGGLHGPPSSRLLGVDADSVFPAQDLSFVGIDDYSDPLLRLFLVDRDTPPQRLRDLLAAAWDVDPSTTLKLVCNLSSRDPGNAHTVPFTAAAVWMHHNHPRTLACNLPAFAELGLIKDFAELLHRLVQRADDMAPPDTISRKRARSDDDDKPHQADSVPIKTQEVLGPVDQAMGSKPAGEAASAYSNLFNSIADLFETILRHDLNQLQNGGAPSLAADWCPSSESTFNGTTQLYQAIARRYFPRDADLDVHLASNRLRDEVLVPLQSAPKKKNKTTTPSKPAHGLPHKIVTNMGRESADLTRKNRAIDRWKKMLNDMRSKGSLRNCVAVCDMMIGAPTEAKKVGAAMGLLISQLSAPPWEDVVHAFTESQVAEPLSLTGKSYEQKVEAIRTMQCDDRFNLKTIFEWVLVMYGVYGTRRSDDEQQVKAPEAVKTIFVFTYKDFDKAIVAPSSTRSQYSDPQAVRPWKDEYEIICDKFEKKGFRYQVPDVVFWNLAGERSPALTFTDGGVMRLSGYSDDFMRLFLEKSGVVEPRDEMYGAIAEEKYQKLEVYD